MKSSLRVLVCAVWVMMLLPGQAALAEDAPDVIRLSEPVEVTEAYETFGAPMSPDGEPITLSSLLAGHNDYLDRSVAVRARVSQVCQMKGCFFIAQDGDATVRVSFKDYGFFVPTDISGRQVTLVGELKQREVSADEAAHYADDLGGPDTDIKPGRQFEIVATSVRVPRE